MRQQLPKQIDPFKFAQNGRELEGEITVAELPRLVSALHDDKGTVNVSMRFDIDRLGTPYMVGKFDATLTLTCERCMGPMPESFSIDCMLALVKHEKLVETLADQYEPWVIEGHDPVALTDVVEDELILALPLVPRHDSDCLPEEAWFSGEKEIEEKAEKPASPFAVLSALKSKK